MQAGRPLDSDLMDLLIVLHIVSADLKLESNEKAVNTGDDIRLAFTAKSVAVEIEVINTSISKVSDRLIL